MKNRKFDNFDLLPVGSHEIGEFKFRPEFKIKGEFIIERIILKSVEEDEFEIERVVEFVEEYGVKESARGLKLSEEEVIKKVSEYIKNVNRRILDLQKMVDQESRRMANEGKCGTELQESLHLKTSNEEGGDKSVHVQEMWTSRVVGNREFVLLHTTKLADIIGYREYELEQMIKVVESMKIEFSGHNLGLEYLEVVNKVREYIRLKKSRIEFLHNVVQESDLMREKRGRTAMNTDQEPHLDNSVCLAEFVSHQELLCKKSNKEKEGDKSVCVDERNERKGETESGQESHLKTGDKSVYVKERENEPVSGTSGGMSTAGMQMGGQERGRGDSKGQLKQKSTMMQPQQSVYEKEYPPLPGSLTGQKQLSVEESNERDSESKSGQKTSNEEKEEDGESVHVEERIVKESEPKAGQESHLKSLDEEKEDGDKSAHVEVRNERESVLESGQMTLNEEKEGGDESVNHVEEKNAREVKSESGQQLNEEKVSTESVNVEARNEKGIEEVTGGGMLTISREVGDSMQVAGQGQGRGSSRDQQLQQRGFTREYRPLQGHSSGQQQLQPSVEGRGWGRGHAWGQQPQNAVTKEDPPAPGPFQGALASYIDNALARKPPRPRRRGQKVQK